MNIFKKVLSGVLSISLILPSVGRIHAGPESDVCIVEHEKIYTGQNEDFKDYKEMYLEEKTKHKELKNIIINIKQKNKIGKYSSIHDFVFILIGLGCWIGGCGSIGVWWGLGAFVFKLISIIEICNIDTLNKEVEQMAKT